MNRLSMEKVADLYVKQNGRLVDLSVRIVRCRETARDVVMEVWEVFMMGKGPTEEGANYVGWLHTSVRNRSIDYLRRKRNRVAHVGVECVDGAVRGESGCEMSAYMARDHAEVARKAICEIGGNRMGVVMDLCGDGYTVREIAGKMGISPATVTRCLKGIRVALNHQNPKSSLFPMRGKGSICS